MKTGFKAITRNRVVLSLLFVLGLTAVLIFLPSQFRSKAGNDRNSQQNITDRTAGRDNGIENYDIRTDENKGDALRSFRQSVGATPTPSTCTPSTTVSEGDLFPGGISSFGVSQGPGFVRIDHVNAGTGTQSITLVGAPVNAVVNIPAFTPGTFAPVDVTFTVINPALPVDFNLRAASTFHAAFIRVRCGVVTPTPTPVASPTPTPGTCPAFTNATPIVIPDSGSANPYPSGITTAGLGGTVTNVTLTLNNLNHTFPDDIDVLLVGPGGQSVILMSDVGGSGDLVNVNLTFDDAAAAMLPDTTQIVSGTFKPSNFEAVPDTFPAPAPAAPYGSMLSAFNGTAPNGTWSLYVMDDAAQDLGSISGGWTLNITTTNCGGTLPTPTPVTTPTPSGTPGMNPAGTTGTLDSRLFRGSVVGTCAANTFPGTFTGGPFIYNTHRLRNNTNSPLCITVTLTVNTEGTVTNNLQVAAFLAPFAPGDINTAARYLGDPGTSSGSPPLVTTFQVTIPANTDFDLAVFSTNPSPASQGGTYTLNVTPGSAGCTLTGVVGTAPSGNSCTF